eukprot:6821365-Ditylum_brightwellii.AAC.1
MGAEEKDISSHYEFRRLVTLSYLDPDIHWPSRSSRLATDMAHGIFQSAKASVRVDQDSRSRGIRGSRIMDESLQPTGSLRCRLDHTTLSH